MPVTMERGFWSPNATGMQDIEDVQSYITEMLAAFEERFLLRVDSELRQQLQHGEAARLVQHQMADFSRDLHDMRAALQKLSQLQEFRGSEAVKSASSSDLSSQVAVVEAAIVDLRQELRD